jgi:protein-disulfide isomerase
MRRFIFLLGAALSLAWLAASAPAVAQSGDDGTELRREIEALRQGQAAIYKELEEIKALLRKATGSAREKPFQPTAIGVAGAPILGEADARVTIVEFSDYQCPFCLRHVSTTLPQIKKAYIETGKVRYVMREFPIESIHPKAFKASEAALCAGDQGKYWEMHDLIFRDQKQVEPEDLEAHAETLRLDMAAFVACFESDKYAERVRADLKEGVQAGVRGTPSFFVGLTDPADPDKITATRFIRGAQRFAVFQQAIEEMMKQASSTVETPALQN